jgi:Fur family transcriptional regulator, peroxide stress response regulator
MIIQMEIDPEVRFNTMLAKLNQRNCRITSHRLALIHMLAPSVGHPNAASLFKQLRMQFPTASLATVYKTLTLLKEEGELLEIDLHSDRHYDGNKPFPHPHLICSRCGKILDGDGVSLTDSLNQEIEEKYNFRVEQSQLLFYGICAECWSNKQQGLSDDIGINHNQFGMGESDPSGEIPY